MKKSIITSILAMFLFCLLIQGFASANLMLREPSVDVHLKQGEAFKGNTFLENVSDKPLQVSVDFADTLDKDGKPIKNACSKWIQLEDDKFIIPPKSFKELKFSVSVPKNAEGGFWTALVYSFDNGQVQGPSGISFNIKMHIEQALRVYVTGTIKKKLSVDGINVSYSKGELEISSKVKDTGNGLQDVRAVFLIIDSAGNLVRSAKGNTLRLQPGEEKEISYKNKIGLNNGTNKIIAVFDYEGEELLTIEKKFSE